MFISEIEEKKYYLSRNGMVIYDRSNLGKILLKGKDRIDLLNRLCATDLSKLGDGMSASAVLTTEKGRVIDLLFCMNSSNDTIILTGRQNEQKVIDWFDKFTFTEDFSAEDITGKFNIMYITGREPERLLNELGVDLPGLTDNTFLTAGLKSIPVYFFRDICGINIMTQTQNYCDLNKIISAMGFKYEITDMGRNVFDARRIEKGIPLFGHEIKEDYTPMEIGLTKYISFNKGCYPGQEVIARLDSQDKVRRSLRGIVINDWPFQELNELEPLPEIYTGTDKVGQITSINYSYQKKSLIGLCIVNKSVDINADVTIKTGENFIKAYLSQLPFQL